MGLLYVASVHNASFEFVLTRLYGCDPVLAECGPHINWLTCIWDLALPRFMHLGLNWRALCWPTFWNQTSLSDNVCMFYSEGASWVVCSSRRFGTVVSKRREEHTQLRRVTSQKWYRKRRLLRLSARIEAVWYFSHRIILVLMFEKWGVWVWSGWTLPRMWYPVSGEFLCHRHLTKESAEWAQ